MVNITAEVNTQTTAKRVCSRDRDGSVQMQHTVNAAQETKGHIVTYDRNDVTTIKLPPLPPAIAATATLLY
jgi:hypothetical protein